MAAKKVVEKFDFSSLPDQPGQEQIDFSSLPDKSTSVRAAPTLAERATSAVKEVANYPLGLPANPSRVAGAIGDMAARNPARGYYELMPQMEKGAAMVKSAKQDALVNILARGSYSKPVEYGVNAANLALDLAPFEPSSYAQAGAGLAVKAALSGLGAFRLPFQSASVAEKGLQGAVQELGQQDISREAAGQALRVPYEERVGSPLREMTKPAAEAVRPPAARSGQEILKPEFDRVAGQVFPKEVDNPTLGKMYTEKHKSNLGAALAKEKADWSVVSEAHSDAPAVTTRTKPLLESLRPQKETPQVPTPEPSGPNPHYDTPYGPRPSAPAEPPKTPSIQSGHLQSGYSVLDKLASALEGDKKLTWGQQKTFKSELGREIDWYGRGDQLNHIKKQVWGGLAGDLEEGSVQGGFRDEVANATKSSRDLHKYADLPSSKIIGKAKYPEDAVSRLIRADSANRVEELFREQKLTEPAKNAVRRNVLDELYKKSNGDPRRFVAALDKMGSTKKALFGDKTDLVDSLRNTVDILEKESAAAKVKTPKGRAYAPEDILSRSGQELDKIMTKSHASELVTKIVADGSPEMARTVSGALGRDGAKLMRRATINNVVESSFEKGGEAVSMKKLAKNLDNMSPEFIDELFGEDARLVKGLRKATGIYATKAKAATENPFNFPVYKEITELVHLWKRYRLPEQMRQVLEKSLGKSAAERIIPPREFGVPGIKSLSTKDMLTPLSVAPTINENQ